MEGAPEWRHQWLDRRPCSSSQAGDGWPGPGAPPRRERARGPAGGRSRASSGQCGQPGQQQHAVHGQRILPGGGGWPSGEPVSDPGLLSGRLARLAAPDEAGLQGDAAGKAQVRWEEWLGALAGRRFSAEFANYRPAVAAWPGPLPAAAAPRVPGRGRTACRRPATPPPAAGTGWATSRTASRTRAAAAATPWRQAGPACSTWPSPTSGGSPAASRRRAAYLRTGRSAS